jgi:rod shape-determining protein MreD
MRPILLLLALGGTVAQSSVVPAISVAGVTPDLPLIITILIALRRGPEAGCLTGFAAGLLQDAAAGTLIGVQALTKALIGFGIGVAGPRLRVTQPLVQVPGLVLLSLTEGLVRFVLLKLFHFPAPFGQLMMYVVFPQALYNGFLAAALVLALSWAESVRGRVS